MTDTTEAPTRSREGGGSLRPVLRVIPEECYDNPTWKGLAYVLRDLAIYGLIVAGLLLADQWWQVLILWVLAGFSVAGLFVLGHDAAHGSLFKSSRLNAIVGKTLFVPSLHVFEAWVLGHNRIHHGHTVREGMDFVWHPLTAEDYQQLGRYRRLQHRVEWSAVGAGPYYMRQVWWNKMIRLKTPPAKWEAAIHRDTRLLAVAAGTVTIALGWIGWADSGLYGALWTIFKVQVVPFLLFMYFIGWAVYVHHIHPDVRWYRRREWNKFAGQMEGTTVLRAPRGFDFFFHRIFVHVPHHVDMRIPFYKLEAAADAIEEAFPGTIVERPLSLRDYVATTRSCKLYDFDAQQWGTYDEASPTA